MATRVAYSGELVASSVLVAPFPPSRVPRIVPAALELAEHAEVVDQQIGRVERGDGLRLAIALPAAVVFPRQLILLGLGARRERGAERQGEQESKGRHPRPSCNARSGGSAP